MLNAEVTEFSDFAPASKSTIQQPVRVLYLDDDEIDRTLMRMHVKRHLRTGVEVQCVETVCEAREAMATRRFDYLVTDNRLPPISNYRETLDELDLSSFEGRIIVVSSETRFETFNSETDERVHSITDKSDLSDAIKNGMFDRF